MKKFVLLLTVTLTAALAHAGIPLGSTYGQVVNALNGDHGLDTGIDNSGNRLITWRFRDGQSLTAGFHRGLIVGMLFECPYPYSQEEINNLAVNSTGHESSNFRRTGSTKDGHTFASADEVYVALISYDLRKVFLGFSGGYGTQQHRRSQRQRQRQRPAERPTQPAQPPSDL